jgi:hypothetical protein
VAPYFVLVALVHAVAVATRFPDLAAKLPHGTDTALMVGQFPLILLSGFFEGQLDYGPTIKGFPLWMRIKSTPVKLAFTFAFIYVTVVFLQTFHFSVGPVDPNPPDSFPLKQRAMWFAMFTGGFFMIYFMAATGIFIPLLRALTRPLRALPKLLGALLSLVLGGALGVGVFALGTKESIAGFFDKLNNAATTDPLAFVVVFVAGIVIPMGIGLVLDKVNRE